MFSVCMSGRCQVFVGFFKKDFRCVLTIKFYVFLSVGNFAFNAEMPAFAPLKSTELFNRVYNRCVTEYKKEWRMELSVLQIKLRY